MTYTCIHSYLCGVVETFVTQSNPFCSVERLTADMRSTKGARMILLRKLLPVEDEDDMIKQDSNGRLWDSSPLSAAACCLLCVALRPLYGYALI